MTWECKKCGICCKNVDGLAPHLDRGDGTCKDFDDETKLCKIYETRPIECRVEDLRKQYYRTVPEEDYYRFQAAMCLEVNKRRK